MLTFRALTEEERQAFMGEPTNWHILIITEGGTVSLLKNLTKALAQQTIKKLEPAFREGIWQVQPSDIKTIHIMGPEGETLR